jgi:hypothetical protein
VKLEANDLVMVLLCNLPKFNNNLIIALKSRAKVDLNIDIVKTKLLHVELKKDIENLSHEVFILVACTSKATSSNFTTYQKVATKRDRKQNLCNYCKKPNHWV